MSSASPIAIVGMSCRLSGGVSTPEDLWTMIARSRDGWGPIPKDRFSADAYYHPNPQKKGCFNVKSGYFMDKDLSQFDAPFFNITEQEAIAMDPQQRQLLECTYEALESAGIPKETLSGKQMGVFVGATSSSYRMGTLRDLNQVPLFDSTGNHQSIQAARISHYFNLRGPCFSIDTACSSSLYALHAAVQSIRSGETDSAIVAGCSLHLHPNDMVSMSMLGIFNNHGKTFSFDHRAKSGFARGEGVGCLILKPLEQALKDNDRIRCIITNTGTNQDGKTVGLSTPSGEAQEQLIREVYSRVGISPNDTGYVEAHGTGTKVGDPIEAGALHRVFGNGRTKRAPLYMGSVKSNVGHLENASGIISIIKACLMLEKGFILPNVNFEKANEAIPLEEWHMKVPVNLRPWPKDKRYISINNFGFGGSNAHAVVERIPLTFSDFGVKIAKEQPKLFVLCAYDEGAAKRMTSQLSVYLEQHPEIFEKRIFNDIAYTLSERRSHLPWRVAITASSCNDLAMSLNNAAHVPKRSSNNALKIGFIYTGQGAQWAQMGRELMDVYPIFASTLHAASSCLEQLGANFSLVEELLKPKEASKIGQAHLSQPICTAVQLGLTALLDSWGIKPSMVLGHSSGEIVAAYAAGAITIPEAMSAAYHRGQVALLAKARHPDLRGAMMAVGCDASEIQHKIKLLGLYSLTAACHNSPNSTTVSGDEDAIDKLAAELERDGTFNRKLRVDVAYHSPHMGLVAEDYMTAIGDIAPQPCRPDVAFYSSLVGKYNTTETLGASYWVNNLVRPVLFSTALQSMYQNEKPDVLIEVGPHAALEGPIKQILRSISSQASAEVKYFPTLVRNQDSAVALIDLAGKMFLQGHGVKFSEINQTNVTQPPNVITDFPPYPWSSHQYWYESRASKQHRLKPFARHDFLGTLDDNYTDSELTWRNVVSVDDIPWLKDHRMQSLVTFPLAGYLCMAIEASSQRAQLRQVQLNQLASFRLREVNASKAFIMDSTTQYETVVSLRPYTEGTRSQSNDWDEFCISSCAPSRGWLEHCRGLVSAKKSQTMNTVNSSRFQAAHSRWAEANDQGTAAVPVALDDMYSELCDRGAEYGSAFMNLAGHTSISGDYTIGSVTVPDTAVTMHSAYETPSILPASFMDLMLQFTFPLLGAGFGTMPSLFMPSAISDMEISTKFPNVPGTTVQALARGHLNRESSGPVSFCIDAWHPSCQEPVVTMEGFKMSPVNSDVNADQKPRSLCYKVQWEPFEQGPLEDKPEESLVNGDNHVAVVNGTAKTLLNGHPEPNGEPYTNGDSHGDSLTNGASPNAHVNGCNGVNGVHSSEPEVNGKVNGFHETNGVHGTNEVNGTNGFQETNGVHKPNKVNGTNGVHQTNGVHVPNGTIESNGTGEPNGLNELNGIHQTNGVHEPNGINGTNGLPEANGIHQTNGVHVPNGLAESNGTHEQNGLNGHNEMHPSPSTLNLENSNVVLVSDCDQSDNLTSSLLDMIKSQTDTQPLVSSFAGLEPASTSHYICLLELDQNFVSGMSEQVFKTLQTLLLTGASVLWVTSGAYRSALNPERNMAQGMFRSVRSETGKTLATLDLDPNSMLDATERAGLIIKAFAAITRPADGTTAEDFEFYEDGGKLLVPRVVVDDGMNRDIFHRANPMIPYDQDFQQTDRRFKMVVGTAGALDSLYWKDDPEQTLPENEIEIKVACTGINFKDVVIAMGQLASPYIGVECSGTVARIGAKVTSLAVGDRVCAVPLGAYGTFARCLASSAAVIPQDMSFTVAASIPVVYCTAYYGIMDLAQIESGEKILIHAASGGVGQAAIQLAQMIGAEIYATVGSAEKKQLLIDTYGIPESRIFYSRDGGFGPAIRHATGGRGVDVVINSLAGDLLRETWACLAPFGRFIEIGKRDITTNSRLDMLKFDSNCTFSSVDLTLVAAERPKLMSRIMGSVMNLLRRKIICPIGPITETSIGEVEKSLRKLQSGKTSGKVIVDHSKPAKVKATHPTVAVSVLCADATYIIIGGTGGIGCAIARKLVQQGARHVVLLSRSGKSTDEVSQLVNDAKELDATIYVEKCDVADRGMVSALVSELRKLLPPVRGIIHAAMVLRDMLFEKMTFEDYDAVIRSKVSGALNFHNEFHNDKLDFFIMLSSVAGIVGNRGQAAYSAANTFLDALAHHRRQNGMAASSLNLTAVDDVGYLASNSARKSEVLKNISGSSMCEAEVLGLVEAAIRGEVEAFSSGQCITGLDLDNPTMLPFWASDGKFHHIRQQALAASASLSASADLSVAEKLKNVSGKEEAIEIVASELGDKLAAILMMAPEDMAAQKGYMSITAFGLDSLNAIELRNWIGKELQAHLQVLELLTSGKLTDLAALVLRKTRLSGTWTKQEG